VKKSYVFILLGMLVTLSGGNLCAAGADDANKDRQAVLKSVVNGILKAEEDARKIAEPYLRVRNQNPGDKVVVSYVDYDKNTFVVIKKPGMYGGEELLGVSGLLTAGRNENIDISLSVPVAGTVLTAYLFVDDGDGIFSESIDPKAKDPRNDLILCQNFDVRTK